MISHSDLGQASHRQTQKYTKLVKSLKPDCKDIASSLFFKKCFICV